MSKLRVMKARVKKVFFLLNSIWQCDMSTRLKFISVLFPGSSIYNFNEHEMWEKGKTKDAEVQTEDPQESTTHHTSQDLVETADFGLTGQVRDNSPSALVDPGESEVFGLFV